MVVGRFRVIKILKTENQIHVLHAIIPTLPLKTFLRLFCSSVEDSSQNFDVLCQDLPIESLPISVFQFWFSMFQYNLLAITNQTDRYHVLLNHRCHDDLSSSIRQCY